MNPGTALLYGLLAFMVTLFTTPAVRALARRFGVIDDPATSPERKLHRQPTPLLGGLAILLGVVVAVLAAAQHPLALFSVFGSARVLGVVLGTLLVAIGGMLDDVRNLPARTQILFPLFGAILVVGGGIAIEFISNPFGGVLRFDAFRISLPWNPGGLPLIGAVLTVGWILSTSYAAKLLDGLDGLVTGIGAIGAFTVYALSVRPPVNQPETAVLAAVLAGACLGFLPWNWHPARIFLGEVGSTGIGFALGTLSVISGGKIATALLILGLPLLDVLWVVLRRALTEGRSPFTTSDRKHLHHRLLALGLSHRAVVALLYGLTAAFGALAVYTAGPRKFAALVLLLVVMALLGIALALRGAKRIGRSDG